MKLFKELNKRVGTKFNENFDIDLAKLFMNYRMDEDLIEKCIEEYPFNLNKRYDKYRLVQLALMTQSLSDDFIKKYSFFCKWEDIFFYQTLSEDFIEQNLSKVDWDTICMRQFLSEDFISRHSDKVNWKLVSHHQILSEDFINKYQEKVDWEEISHYQILSEEFIEKFKENVNWAYISAYQKLSEGFISDHISYVILPSVFAYQKLSENFIANHARKPNDWQTVSTYQKLSEEFIEKHKDKVDWQIVSKFQKLSEKFIERHKNELDFDNISGFQKLSDKFIKENNLLVNSFALNDNWIYKDSEFKKKAVTDTGLYECHDDYFVGYKAIRNDRYSLFGFKYKYEKDGTYESWCDCSYNNDSFGLNVGTKEYARKYGSIYGHYMIVRCKVRYEDVGRVVRDGEKIRCFKIEVID